MQEGKRTGGWSKIRNCWSELPPILKMVTCTLPLHVDTLTLAAHSYALLTYGILHSTKFLWVFNVVNFNVNLVTHFKHSFM